MNGPVGALALAGILVAVIVGSAGIWMTAQKAGLSGLGAVAPHRSTFLMIRMAGLENWKIPRIALLLGPFLPASPLIEIDPATLIEIDPGLDHGSWCTI
jgi:hypothetical protein